MRRNKQIGITTIRIILLVIVIGFAGGYFYSLRYSGALLQDLAITSTSPTNPGNNSALGFSWPPEIDQPFPDIELYSHTGELIRLSDFKGKVILVEPIGMTCPACNAFSGAGQKGGYKGISPQQNLPPIESLLPQYANGTTLDDDRLVLVQLMLYDMNFKAPTIEESREWAEHFGLDNKSNVYILAGDERFINKASYDMIPGFFLVDKDFILRSDSTGHYPKHGLYNDLLPKVSELLASVNLEQTRSSSYIESPDYRSFSEKLYADLDLSMPIEKAYQSIPHKQTTFSPDQSKIKTVESDYLYQLFSIVDVSIVERVQTLHWHQTAGRQGANNNNYDQILSELGQMEVPDSLKQAHKLIQQAINQQNQYFKQINSSNKYSFNASDPMIQTSHAKLIQAYTLLMARFPQENQHNKVAFFDHLCALDFI